VLNWRAKTWQRLKHGAKYIVCPPWKQPWKSWCAGALLDEISGIEELVVKARSRLGLNGHLDEGET
jgi:hypothetical protein